MFLYSVAYHELNFPQIVANLELAVTNGNVWSQNTVAAINIRLIQKSDILWIP